LSWRSSKRRTVVLLSLTALALIFQGILEETRVSGRDGHHELKLAAAAEAAKAFQAVRKHRMAKGIKFDPVNDPAGTGLVGPRFSPLTSVEATLEGKLASLNPNWAAVMIQHLHQAGLTAGDPVAVSITGSYPGANICLFAALKVMRLEPVIITSVSASAWGASDPDFTWLDMESLLYREKIFPFRSSAATLGGSNDMGRGLSPEGRHFAVEAIERNGIHWLESKNLEDAIAKRDAFFTEYAKNRRCKAYVSVGGGAANLGNRRYEDFFATGVFHEPSLMDFSPKGNLILMLERGVPAVNFRRIEDQARVVGLPIAPERLPQPGEGRYFAKTTYNLSLAVVFLLTYCAVCVMVLAPEVHRGLFDRWSGKSNGNSV